MRRSYTDRARSAETRRASKVPRPSTPSRSRSRASRNDRPQIDDILARSLFRVRKLRVKYQIPRGFQREKRSL